MRKNHPNFRRDVKNLWKNYQKGEISAAGIQDWFEERGLIGNGYSIKNILQSKVPSKIFSRLGRAALKKGKMVKIYDILQVEFLKEREPIRNHRVKLYGESYKKYFQFHTLPFYTPALREITFRTIEKGWVNDEENFINF